ncbi:ribosomal protein L1-like protein [Gigaspora rosea]|uniref:Ribosomal protein L1-like protein n=1 Tax=Gigaspora rosea TaxID=44941 RepID=A0A397UTE8_9GLOM|nr:ribosomal protein L1-like protein [Gigaspora rosea]
MVFHHARTNFLRFHQSFKSIIQINSFYFPENVKVVLPQIREYARRRRRHAAKVIPDNSLPFTDAVSLIKAVEVGKPNSTWELHVELKFEKGAPPIRGSIFLPRPMSKTNKFLVFAKGAKAQEALEAGAHTVGGDELIAEIANGTFKFEDINKCLATPDIFPEVSKIARILGPKHLMPMAKRGTVTNDIASVIKDLTGKQEIKSDKAGVLFWPITDLRDNIKTILQEINKLGKSHSTKLSNKDIITNVALSSTRGPGIYLLDYKILFEKANEKLIL